MHRASDRRRRLRADFPVSGRRAASSALTLRALSLALLALMTALFVARFSMATA